MATASATDSSRTDHYYYHGLQQRPQPRHDNGRFGFDAGCFGFGFDADRFAFDAPAHDNDSGKCQGSNKYRETGDTRTGGFSSKNFEKSFASQQWGDHVLHALSQEECLAGLPVRYCYFNYYYRIGSADWSASWSRCR